MSKNVIRAFPSRKRKQVALGEGSREAEIQCWNDGGKVCISIDIDRQTIQIWLDPNDETLQDAIALAKVQLKRDLPKVKRKTLAFHEKLSRNMMSKKVFVEPVGTSNHCSPSSEAYWSM